MSRTELHDAVRQRDAARVRALLESGADPYAGTGIYALREAATPYAMALDRGYGEIVELFRAHRSARPDAATELRRAVEAGDEFGVIELLERHPELMHWKVRGGWTVLHVASAALLERVAEWLLDHGAEANAAADNGTTPLDVAGRYRRGEAEAGAAMAQLLLRRGANMTERAAVMMGDLEFLKGRAAEADIVTPRDLDGWLLRLAVDYERPEILTWLLDRGLDPDARVAVVDDPGAFTWGMPLYECTRGGRYEMAEMLLARGADPNGQVYASGTPLSEAYGQRDDAMVALLERYGGKSNATMAGLYRRADLAERLLAEHGDEPLPDDGFGSGPVAEQLASGAARGGDAGILRMALERVKVPVGDARWNGLLTQPLGFWNHWIGPWCHLEWDRAGYLECFRMILERSGAPNLPLRDGATVLHQIVVMGDHVRPEERLGFAAAALDAGARTDLRDELLESTPLGWACRWGREDLVRLLLDRGADPVEADGPEWARPAAWAERRGHAGVLELLRAKGPGSREPGAGIGGNT